MVKKILIINDDKSIREILKLYLEIKKYEVYQAADGFQGVDEAKKALPDLILSEVTLPGINGYEVCRKLKEDPNTREIPVIFLSGLLATDEKIRGLESGGVDFINNAADYAEILARIETHIKIKELNQQLQFTNRELLLQQKILNEDLRAAAMIQKSLLPLRSPNILDLDIAWSCVPCALVGGDICNIHPISDDTSVFYVLDVSGHGVSSAMVTVSITQYIQQKLQMGSNISPRQILIDLNQAYPYENFNMFSTIFYMVFNSQTAKLTYSSAGHPPAVFLSPIRPFELLSGDGILIGVDPNFLYEEKEVVLQEGEKLILYTDGVTELTSSLNNLYGEERLYNLLEQVKSLPIKEIVRIVSGSLREFAGSIAPRDDITLLGIEFKKKRTKRET